MRLSVDPIGKTLLRNIYLDGDSQKLGQIFRNLLSNALKFTKAGGEIQVQIESLEEIRESGRAIGREIDVESTRCSRIGWGCCESGVTIPSLGRCATSSRNARAVNPAGALQSPTRTYSLKIKVIDDGVGISKVDFALLFCMTTIAMTRIT